MNNNIFRNFCITEIVRLWSRKKAYLGAITGLSEKSQKMVAELGASLRAISLT
jgi:hypothetical protein